MALGSQKEPRMPKKQKVELVKVEANSDTQRVLKQLIAALEKQGFNIQRKRRVIDRIMLTVRQRTFARYISLGTSYTRAYRVAYGLNKMNSKRSGRLPQGFLRTPRL